MKDMDFNADPGPRAGPWILLVVAAIACLAAAVQFFSDAQRWLRASEQSAELAEQLARAPTNSARDVNIRPGSAAPQKVSRESMTSLDRPWPEVFDVLERVDTGRSRLTAVAVDSRFSEVRLSLEAQSIADVFEFVGRAQRAGGVVSSAYVLNTSQSKTDSVRADILLRLQIRQLEQEPGKPHDTRPSIAGLDHEPQSRGTPQ
jgi:hypothetical protein